MHSYTVYGMPYLIQFVPLLFFFLVFSFVTPLPLSNYRLHRRRKRCPRQRKRKKKNDNAVKIRQGDKITEKK